MFYVTLYAQCVDRMMHQTKFWALNFAFRDQGHFKSFEETGFSNLIETFNRGLPREWRVADAIGVQAVHGESRSGLTHITTVD